MVHNERTNISISPETISLKQTEKIVEQMKNSSICRINNHGKSTGFFVKVSFKSKLLPVFITINHAKIKMIFKIIKSYHYI